MVLTEGQIKAQVRAIRKAASRSARAFALRSDGPWGGPPRITIDQLPHRVAFCRSDLELRELLRAADSEKEPLVALCPFDSGHLGEDVLARLAKRRVHPPDAMEILQSLFQATLVDARVLASTPLKDALIEHAPADGYPPVAGGVLDLQTAWCELLSRTLGDRDVAISIDRWLEASLEVGFRSRLDRLPLALKREFFAWGALNVDSSLKWMEWLATADKTSDLVPLGLLLDLAFRSADKPNAVLAARLESWFGGQAIDASAARSWAAAARSATQSIRQRSGPLLSTVTSRFDALLAEFKIAESAWRSDFSRDGFEQRMRRFAGLLDSSEKRGAAKLIGALESLRIHQLAGEQPRRIEQCEMAARLALWLSDGARLGEGSSLDDMVEGYVRFGGFVDWARAIVEPGDSNPELNKTYRGLLARAEEVCGTFEAHFAAKVADWTLHGSAPSASLLPIENALEHLIGPLAAKTPILLLVMDGMSAAVFRELIGDLLLRGHWLECQPSQVKAPSALLATVPSITEVSRRALFRGKLHPESTPTEKSAFSTNDRLFSLCGGRARPMLFLKGDLHASGETGLASAMKDAIANRKCHLVATVLNAIDDQLSGSDQITQSWNLDSVRPLTELLRLAAEAGRAVILTSDHGHVLEHQTTLKAGMTNGGDRYRTDGGAPMDGELRLTGERIRQANGRDDITVAWSRHIRYSPGKKRGYHGGVSPQEMVIPLAILRHLKGQAPEGWRDISPSPFCPGWWRLTTDLAPAFSSDRTADPQVTAGLDLFTHAKQTGRADEWIGKLLGGELYREQGQLGVRGAVDRAEVELFLATLNARGGTILRDALAERLGLPLLRLNGHVQNLARIFNVDGYEVLTLDSASGTVKLDLALLKKQFAVTD